MAFMNLLYFSFQGTVHIDDAWGWLGGETNGAPLQLLREIKKTRGLFMLSYTFGRAEISKARWKYVRLGMWEFMSLQDLFMGS